jgi:hypothetical protein
LEAFTTHRSGYGLSVELCWITAAECGSAAVLDFAAAAAVAGETEARPRAPTAESSSAALIM